MMSCRDEIQYANADVHNAVYKIQSVEAFAKSPATNFILRLNQFVFSDARF